MALSFIETKLRSIEVDIAGIEIFDLCGSCDLNLDRMTVIYELNPYPLETYWTCENERLTSKAFESYRIKGGECVRLVTRGLFQSRDKDGGYTIRSAVVKNFMTYANLMALSHAGTVVLECFKDDNVRQWKSGKFNPLRNP